MPFPAIPSLLVSMVFFLMSELFPAQAWANNLKGIKTSNQFYAKRAQDSQIKLTSRIWNSQCCLFPLHALPTLIAIPRTMASGSQAGLVVQGRR